MKRIITILAVIMLVCAFVGTPAFAAGEKAKDTAAGQHMKEMRPGERAAGAPAMGQQMAAQSYRASNIIDYKVKGAQGEDLGDVEDILISQDGRVQYIMVSHGGVLGIGENLVPVPFSVARVNMADNTIVLQNVDKSKLEQAPTFTKEDWQQRAGDVQFERDVYGYYGQEMPRRDMEMQRTPGTTEMKEKSYGTPKEEKR